MRDLREELSPTTISSYLFKLFAKVIVEPSVKKRIVAGAAHGKTMRHKKAKSVVGPIVGQ